MKAWIWATAVSLSLEFLAKMIALGTGEIPKRSAGTIAFDAVFIAVMLGWLIYVVA